jgi:hypothetical protein
VRTFVWDESLLGLDRSGDALTITDRTSPTVTAHTVDFGRAMVEQGRRLVAAAAALRQETLNRAGPPERLKDRLRSLGTDQPTSKEPGDMAAVSAIVWGEVAALEPLPALLDTIAGLLPLKTPRDTCSTASGGGGF